MKTLLVAALFSGLLSSPSRGEEDNLFGPGQTNEAPRTQSGAPALRLVPSGTLDLRAIRSGGAIGWEYGGPGLSRYGAIAGNVPPGTRSGLRPDASLKAAQAGLDLDILIRERPTFHLQLNYDDRPSETGRAGSFGVAEVYALLPLSRPFSGRAGVLIPPFSLEHPGAAWSTIYTLTPSAINTWAGEELRVVAIEGAYSLPLSAASELTFQAAVFSHNDPAGTLLSWRGWALHDYQYKLGGRLRVLGDIDTGLTPTQTTSPFEESDGNPGLYGKLSLKAGDSLKVELFTSHNFANPTTVDHPTFGRDYAWRTFFTNLGIEYRPWENFTLVSQLFYGTTLMGTQAVDNELASAFLLASYASGSHRLSARFDWFQVVDRDTNPVDLNAQRGHAQTVAYFYSINPNHRVGAEYVRIHSERPGNTGLATSDVYDDLAQIAYRLTY